MSVVGIDLGTTNTVVACVRDGRVHVLADDKGNRLLPSVVSFHPNGDVLVGPAARERRLVDAKNTIASIKRLIGRPWDSDEIRLARSRFPFELREGPGQGALVIARGEAYTLPEISAFVLKRARQIAEAALGETVDKAVITVPAHFNELQRASTKVAGRVAGLEVLRILNEPTAAALAYGFGSDSSERVAVYDFGGGTFDCSLARPDGHLFEVLATAGDTFLGGDDIDTAIAEVMCNAFLAQHRYDPRVDPQAFERLRAAAEELKKELSVNTQAQVDLPEVAYGVGGKRLGLHLRPHSGRSRRACHAVRRPHAPGHPGLPQHRPPHALRPSTTSSWSAARPGCRSLPGAWRPFSEFRSSIGSTQTRSSPSAQRCRLQPSSTRRASAPSPRLLSRA